MTSSTLLPTLTDLRLDSISLKFHSVKGRLKLKGWRSGRRGRSGLSSPSRWQTRAQMSPPPQPPPSMIFKFELKSHWHPWRRRWPRPPRRPAGGSWAAAAAAPPDSCPRSPRRPKPPPWKTRTGSTGIAVFLFEFGHTFLSKVCDLSLLSFYIADTYWRPQRDKLDIWNYVALKFIQTQFN